VYTTDIGKGIEEIACWTERQFSLHPIQGDFRNAGLSKDHGPDVVGHDYAILTQGRTGWWWTADTLTWTVGG